MRPNFTLSNEKKTKEPQPTKQQQQQQQKTNKTRHNLKVESYVVLGDFTEN